jgi:hypothetical protein
VNDDALLTDLSIAIYEKTHGGMPRSIELAQMCILIARPLIERAAMKRAVLAVYTAATTDAEAKRITAAIEAATP